MKLPTQEINNAQVTRRSMRNSRREVSGIGTINITEEQAMSEIRNLCNPGKPHEKYEIIEKLGSGAEGTVCLALNKLRGIQVAQKTIDLKKQDRKGMLLMELKVLKHLKHKNLINFIECYLVDSELSVMMEYLAGGPLTSVVTKCVMQEDQIAAVCNEILQGLKYLHENNILHRDIKSDNVLLGIDGSVKLIDFGFSARVKETRRTMVGTPYWMAPEVINMQNYGMKMDIWAFGITVLEMRDGEPPYFDKEPMVAMGLIARHGNPKITNWDNYSSEFPDFVEKCLQTRPEHRLSAEELLSHKFLEQKADLRSLGPLIKAANKTEEKQVKLNVDSEKSRKEMMELRDELMN